VQLILTAHLQGSYDNPILGILVILFGMRSFLNFMLVLELGVRSGARSGVEYASTASGMLLVILLGGGFCTKSSTKNVVDEFIYVEPK